MCDIIDLDVLLFLDTSIEGPYADEYMVNVSLAIDSIPGMSVAVARIKAELEEVVTPENERWIRSFHPSLERYESVHVHEDVDGLSIWLVPISIEPKLFHTHAGGREIHYFPWHETAPIYPPIYPFREDPLTHRINCRRLLNPHDLSILRDIYPEAIGVRILITGFIIFLFKTRRSMEACWRYGVFDTIGGRRVGYDVADFCGTSTAVSYGHSITDRPGEISQNQGCLGLRLRLSSGEEVITTTTHAFVKDARLGLLGLRCRIAEWYISIRDSLVSLRPVKCQPAVPATVETRSGSSRSPLDKEIWLAGTNQKVRYLYEFS